MPVITLDQAEAGMTVAADILDRRGRTLVPQGAELSERTLEALRGWGVESLDIEGEVGSLPELDPIEVEAAKAELMERFQRTDVEHPFVAVILDQVARARVRSQGSPAASLQPANDDAS
ncbi:MAG: hypothetical protein ACR2QM_19345 [Longimicrobiales bacterium]